MSINLQTMKARHAAFERLGFRKTNDGISYRQNGMLLTPKRRWCVLETAPSANCDLLATEWNRPGLWKLVSAKPYGAVLREFHLPIQVLLIDEAITDPDPNGKTVIDALMEWAVATSRGTLPDGWSPPSREDIESWIPAGGLTVQDGPIIRQGSLVHAANRLAIRFPIVPSISPNLSDSRLDLLRDVLIDGQSRWRMVRLGFTSPAGRQAIEAEVDLTGAPLEVLQPIFKISLDALRWVVRWIVWSAALLADARVESRVWEGYQSGRGPRKGDG